MTRKKKSERERERERERGGGGTNGGTNARAFLDSENIKGISRH
jgi:hypothetical protein